MKAFEPGGYRWDILVTASQPVHATSDNDACDTLSPSDGVIPLIIQVKNQTAFPTRVGFAINGRSADVSIDGRCYTDQNGYGTEHSASTAVGPGGGITATASAIVHGYYSPDAPQGDTQLLAKATINVSGHDPDVPDDTGGTYTVLAPAGGTDKVDIVFAPLIHLIEEAASGSP